MKRLLVCWFVLFTVFIYSDANPENWKKDQSWAYNPGWTKVETASLYNAGGGWRWFAELGAWGYLFEIPETSNWRNFRFRLDDYWELLSDFYVYSVGERWKWIPYAEVWIYIYLPPKTFEEVVPMVSIPAGDFQMGDSLSTLNTSSRPVRTVTLSPFLIGQTEVSWDQWHSVHEWATLNGYKQLAGSKEQRAPYMRPNHPVTKTNWYEAVKWCNAASEKYGLEPVYLLSEGGEVYRTGETIPFIDYTRNGYRLPTEAEWEKAARGGLEGKRFPWGDTISHEKANYRAFPNTFEFDVNDYQGYHPDYYNGFTSEVDSFQPNGYGLYNVAGNVREYCGDFMGAEYYKTGPTVDPRGPENGTSRIVRGGDWRTPASGCSVFGRSNVGHLDGGDGEGFRISRNRT